MRRSQLALLFVASLGGAASGSGQQAVPPGVAQPGSPIALVGGAYTFRTWCASCHGVDAKGDGPLAENLRFRPPDLTRIAQRAGGAFPTEKVTQIVDGRKPLKGHGGTDMPVWGDAFRNSETGYDEAAVTAKIRGVVDYLKTVQLPPQ